MSGLSLLLIILLIPVSGLLFINLNSELGGNPTKEQTIKYIQSDNYKDGKFFNQIPTSLDMNFKKFISVLGDFLKGDPTRQPDFELPVEKIDSLEITNKTTDYTRLTWFGHSAFLLEMDGKNILIDPMLGESPSPIPVLGSKRYSRELPITINKMPAIDIVVISHDHYDHLDYGSIKKLIDKVGSFYTPLGVGVHLEKWGISKEKIHELDWWDEIKHENLTFILTPSRHFSGRGLFDRNTTLWGSWVIKGIDDNIYFSGDGGYGPHFKEIGEKYGPFDFAMIECGQYDERWNQIHMMPEESARAAVDVKAKLMMPIHWGAFTLALHSWTDPVERVIAKARELDMPVATPKIGEVILLDTLNKSYSMWWEKSVMVNK